MTEQLDNNQLTQLQSHPIVTNIPEPILPQPPQLPQLPLPQPPQLPQARQVPQLLKDNQIQPQTRQQQSIDNEVVSEGFFTQSLADAQDDVTILSGAASVDFGRRRRRRKRNRPRRIVQVNSKEESVEQVRQQAPKPVIQLQPQANNQKAVGQHLVNEQMVNAFENLLVESNVLLNGELPNNIQQPCDFENLFKRPSDKASSHHISLVEDVPVRNEVVLVPLPQICQQLALVSFHKLITFPQQVADVRRLIKSNFREQQLQFIQSRIQRVDGPQNYNVQVLRLIQSGYVWDNVIPFLAETIYYDSPKLRMRLLPQRCNNDSVTIQKYQAFLALSQMFLGLLPRQISTFDLPISFGELMTIGENDSALAVENKLAKLKCVLHYFSSILRTREKEIKNCVEFIAFQRFRVSLKAAALFPQTPADKQRYAKLKLTSHMTVSRVRHGNEFSKETAVYLTHENPARESGEDSFETYFLMEETYRMMYAKPQVFLLRAITPKLDLGEAIIVHGLEQFSRCHWQSAQKPGQQLAQVIGPRQFVCGGLYNEPTDLDTYGKRKGAVIFIMSKMLFGQSAFRNPQERTQRVAQNCSFRQLKVEVETLFSAFQGRKVYCGEEERILISQRYIKFFEDDLKWLYFIVVWIASSLAGAKCVFEFKSGQDETQAVLLMQVLEKWSIYDVFTALSDYRSYILEAQENWDRYVQRLNQDPIGQDGQQLNSQRKAGSMTFLSFLKELYL